MRARRRLFLLVLVSDLTVVGAAYALGLELWLVAVVAVAALLPTLTILAVTTARIRAADNPSSEAERLGHPELVPDRDT